MPLYTVSPVKVPIIPFRNKNVNSEVLLVDLKKTEKRMPRNIKSIFLSLLKLKEIQVTEEIIGKIFKSDTYMSLGNSLYKHSKFTIISSRLNTSPNLSTCQKASS